MSVGRGPVVEIDHGASGAGNRLEATGNSQEIFEISDASILF
jgi:hypothetical protein